MKLTLEVPFGSTATAVVEVSDYTEYGRIAFREAVTILGSDGKQMSKDNCARIISYNRSSQKIFERHGLGPDDFITRVGDYAATRGREVGDAINSALRQLKEEIASSHDVVTEETKNEQRRLKSAMETIRAAEIEGVDNLMTHADYTTWARRYNDVANEGGEGHIPHRITREEYQRALDIVANQGKLRA